MTLQHYTPPKSPAPFAISKATKGYFNDSLSDNTRKAYRRDIQVFSAWCVFHNYQARPAAPETVAEFITHQAMGKLSAYRDGKLQNGPKVRPVTIQRRLAAIAYFHRIMFEEHKADSTVQSPTDSFLVRKVLRGIKRKETVEPVKRAPMTPAILDNLLVRAVDIETLQGLRDKAIMLIGFASAMRASEIVNLKVSHLQRVPEGIIVYFPRSKTDQTGLGQKVPVRPGSKNCPIAAVDAWLKASGIEDGYVFRRLYKGNRVNQEDQPLSTRSISLMIKKYLGINGADDEFFSSHSLRRGFITSAARKGAHITKIMTISRHKSLQTLKGYIDDIEMFENHAGDGLL